MRRGATRPDAPWSASAMAAHFMIAMLCRSYTDDVPEALSAGFEISVSALSALASLSEASLRGPRPADGSYGRFRFEPNALLRKG